MDVRRQNPDNVAHGKRLKDECPTRMQTGSSFSLTMA